MSLRNLIENPVCTASELGLPIPDTVHAVSVALPLWEHVVGYEEGDPSIVSRMRTGYPRFLVHDLVKEVAARMAGNRPCLPFPSRAVAERCRQFISDQCGASSDLVSDAELFGVATSENGSDALKAFWQHSGLIVSTRQAEAHLEGRSVSAGDAQELRSSIRDQVAEFYNCATDDVFLYPTGMAAIYRILLSCIQRRSGQPTIQFGFPYVDTLKVQEKLGDGSSFFPEIDEGVYEKLSQSLASAGCNACYCEIPGNPLLSCPDMSRLVPILRENNVPLIIDDVIATPVNVDVSDYADVVVTSLTKYFAGSGDVMAGAVICNPRSAYYDDLKSRLADGHEDLLWIDDAAVLNAQISSLPERMRLHNNAGLYVAERLRKHPAIKHVWYPRWECNDAYEQVRRPDGGWGSLLSFIPEDAETVSPALYDALPLCKGPSLGTSFTLVCPFTLMAHFNELEWAESCGVSRYLIRMSVGTENPQVLWQRIEEALSKVAASSAA
jgi:cystathionine gamma-synthase